MFRPLNRRTLLCGAAGAMLPLPYLNAMAGSRQEAAAPPLRFAALFKPNGIHPPSWNIEGAGERDFEFSPMMKPFARHRADLLLIDSMGDFGFSSHQASAQRFLSGRISVAGKGKPSLDQLIAAEIGEGTAIRSLELTTEGLFTQNPQCSYISYNSLGRPVPRESDPQLVFDRLFRDPLRSPERRREMSGLLDRVSEHAGHLARRVGREDRETLEQYLTVVRETEKRIETLSRGEAPVVRFETPDRPPIARNVDEQANALLDLVALALWTDSTRCATMMLGNDNSRMIFEFLGIKKEHHYLSHYFRNFERANLEDLYKISLWHMEKFDYLLKRLAEYRIGESRLLDHCVVLYGAGMGESDGHTGKRIPTVLAGGAGGKLKTGRYLRPALDTDLGSLHRSVLDLFGVRAPADHPLAQHTPLAGLDGGPFEAYRETLVESWVREKDGRVEVQGRLRPSADLGEANRFYVDVPGEARPVRLQLSFKALQQHVVPYFCGSAVRLAGPGRREGNEVVLSGLTELRSLDGRGPGQDR